MRKVYKILLFIAILSVFCSTEFFRGYNFSIGSTFEYTLKKSIIDLYLGEYQENFTGTRIGGYNVPDGSSFNIKIEDIYYGGYKVNVSSGVGSEILFYNDEDIEMQLDVITRFATVMPMWFIIAGQSFINYYKVGVQLFHHPFIATDTETWSNIKDQFIEEGDYFSTNIETQNYTTIYEVAITENKKIKQIEACTQGVYNDSSVNIYEYVASYKFAYSQDTGVILGNRFKGYLKGIYDNYTADVSYEQYFDMKSFTLDPFELGEFATENVNGFKLAVIVCSLPLLYFTIIQRRKKSHSHKSVER